MWPGPAKGLSQFNNQSKNHKKPVSQSCAVTKSEKFWQATGQLNLADRMKNCSTGQIAVVCVRKQTLEDFVVACRLYAKFDCPVARQNFSLLATVQLHDCEIGLLWFFQ